MTVQLAEDGAILLLGDCTADDAETLLQGLLAKPDAAIDWRGARSIHTAVIQVLLASGHMPVGLPQGRFLTALIAPSLDRARMKTQGRRTEYSASSGRGRDAT